MLQDLEEELAAAQSLLYQQRAEISQLQEDSKVPRAIPDVRVQFAINNLQFALHSTI